MSPYDLAVRLGISITFDPSYYGPLWTGMELHITYLSDYSDECNGSECRVRTLTDMEFFHEIAHILLCPSKWLKEPDFGFDMNPITCWGADKTVRLNQPQQEQDQEEYEADTLGDLLAFACGTSQDFLVDEVKRLDALDLLLEVDLRSIPRMDRKIAAGKSHRFQKILSELSDFLNEKRA